MTFGRRNIIIGGIAIFVAAGGGMALGFTMEASFPRGFYEMPLTRARSIGRGIRQQEGRNSYFRK